MGDPNIARPEAEGHHEPHRILKPDLFMAVALWMESSPLAERPSDYLRSASSGSPIINKSGAVVVLPNDRALSVDCSQDGVHAAVSALNKFGQERVKGCQVYLSRRPCSFCAKLLVQCEVSKVFYLPIEPECNDPEDALRVDSMFLTSNTGLSIKVPKIDAEIFQHLRQSPYRSQSPQSGAEEELLWGLMHKYWNDVWVGKAKDELRWQAFDDLKTQITDDIQNLMKWIAHTTVLDVPDDIRFVEINPYGLNLKDENQPTEVTDASAIVTANGAQSPIQQEVVTRLKDDSPNPSDKEWQKLALHTSRLAQMLSQRSDDPTRGVGCVLMLHNEIVAIGWNGFPAKALYGEFPRASNTDQERKKKEPYIIHAEQNALLTRNKLNLKDKSSVLYINEVPCVQCIPMLLQAGVKNFVVPKINANRENLKHALDKMITCYGSKSTPTVNPSSVAIRHIPL